MIRNPKDTLVSYYYFFKKWKTALYNGTLDELCERFIAGKIAWCNQINEFTRLNEIHIVHYEDLIEVIDFIQYIVLRNIYFKKIFIYLLKIKETKRYYKRIGQLS